ncbi:MAG: NAD-dependent DNA ligase LigA, partial [Clostridia bacterium]|nr:NAD-dependent DNA ligase LigA [Clostridia bacterium]
SWKLDGLTLVLTYDNGSLTKILTRGNGTVGTNITYMKEAIAGFPLKLSCQGHMVVRGEATISYPDFERINDSLEEDEEKYANPRNLASGTLALDAKHIAKVRERALTFNAFTLVYLEENINSWGERMALLDREGFTTVDRERTDADHLPEVISRWTERVETGEMLIPVDGLVIGYDDTEYASSGSVTGHHATRGGLAFKWQDASAVSTLDHIEWSCAASVITPVAVFDPVQLEGTTVSRASLCNLSELERLGIGENRKTTLEIIKANKIIPKVISVRSREGSVSVPQECPVCKAPTKISVSSSGTKTLRCTNASCPAKNLKKFERFVGKNGLDIDGISSETLKDFINEHFIAGFADIFRLSRYADVIRNMDGYGDKSCENLMAAIEKSRHTDPVKLIVSMSIPLIGSDAAQRFIRTLGWQGFLQRLEEGTGFDDLNGIGPERSNSVLSWYADAENRTAFRDVLSELTVENVEPSAPAAGTCAGLTFVITGDVHIFRNRDEFKAYVEQQGGKVAGSVSGKTSFLVNNDAASQSSKNRKAAELGVPVITEDEFNARFGR